MQHGCFWRGKALFLLSQLAEILGSSANTLFCNPPAGGQNNRLL